MGHEIVFVNNMCVALLMNNVHVSDEQTTNCHIVFDILLVVAQLVVVGAMAVAVLYFGEGERTLTLGSIMMKVSKGFTCVWARTPASRR